MSKTAVVLQVLNVEAFISELKSRGIREVRACTWHQTGALSYLVLKRRFTAYDPKANLILRLDVIYYRGFYYANDRARQQVKEAYEKIVRPVEERISRVAEILDGEYHNGEARW